MGEHLSQCPHERGDEPAPVHPAASFEFTDILGEQEEVAR